MLYVDDARNPFGRMIMCHMMADDTDELLRAADWLGLRREWLQKAGTEYEHFDVSLSMRKRAVCELRARQMTGREMVRQIVIPRRL